MIHGCHFERAEKSHGIEFNLKFILSVGYHVKHKGLSYKDVRRPFIVFFKAGLHNHIKISFEIFYTICLFYSKEICIFALVNCENHKLLP